MTNDFAPWNTTPGAPMFKNSVNHETDWLDSVQALTIEASSLAKVASDEADTWISTKNAAVLADPIELSVQASGYADLWAGQFGVQTPMAKSAFMARLVRLGVGLDEYDEYFEEDRSARVRYEKTEGGDVDTTKAASRTAATGNPFNAHYSDDPAPWKAQFAGVAEGVWSGNGLTFETVEDATAYAQDLLMRWTGADMARVVPTETPLKEPVDPNDPSIVISYRTASRRTAGSISRNDRTEIERGYDDAQAGYAAPDEDDSEAYKTGFDYGNQGADIEDAFAEFKEMHATGNLQTVPDEEIDPEHMPAQAADMIPTTQAFNAGEFTVEGNTNKMTPQDWDRFYKGDGVSSGVPKDIFPEGGIPLHGDLTPEQEAWMKRRGAKNKAPKMKGDWTPPGSQWDEAEGEDGKDYDKGEQMRDEKGRFASRHTGAATLKYDDTGSHWAGLFGGDDYIPLPWTLVSNDGTVLGAWPTQEAAQAVLDSGQMRFVDYDAKTRTFASKNAVANPTLEMRPIYEIAADIKKEWGSNVNFGAVPYLDAMMYISSAKDMFYADSGTTIVSYFLTNASQFRGDRAKELKNELKRHIGRTSSKTAEKYRVEQRGTGTSAEGNTFDSKEEADAKAAELNAQYGNQYIVTKDYSASKKTASPFTTPTTCSSCSKEMMEIDAFPGNVCLECWAASAEGQRMPDAQEVVEMWGGTWKGGSRRHAGQPGMVDENSQDGSATSTLPDVDVASAPENFPQGWLDNYEDLQFDSEIDENGDPQFTVVNGSLRTASITVNGVSLTNVGLENAFESDHAGGGVGVGTDPQGNRVRFRLSAEDARRLKNVLYSDMAMNFSGVDIDEEDIIREGSRRTASDDDDMGYGPGYICPECDFHGSKGEVAAHVESAHGKTATRRTAASPEWLRERVNDPYGTPNKVMGDDGEYVDNPFWVENPYEDINDFRVIERDGKGYVMHRRQNYWMNFNSRDEAVAHARGADGSLDMWASRRTALPGDTGDKPEGARPQTPLEGHDDSAMFEPDEILGQWDEENTATNANTTTARRTASLNGPEFDLFG